MIRATCNGTVIATAAQTRRVEGNHYFPPESPRRAYFTDSRTRSLCPWKGIARYYHITVDERIYADAAWYYPRPLPLARLFGIKGHIAFTGDVRIDQE